ncbi:hypothetical protein I79_018850 [Cricetulus griseus]|uniref:Uncharacterized protein n=1 Tax=Cricetulus griseus TaxID=10029 RepID=G3I5U2_CRIGR|nr:hypothetical protein I79_018850 [Cricetulus griseus]
MKMVRGRGPNPYKVTLNTGEGEGLLHCHEDWVPAHAPQTCLSTPFLFCQSRSGYGAGKEL